MTRYSKFIAAALAFLGVIVASGVLTGQAQAWASAIISGIGAALVYLLPNTPMPTTRRRNEAGQVTLSWSLLIAVVLLLAFLFGWGVLH